jgi:hypothetical protein
MSVESIKHYTYLIYSVSISLTLEWKNKEIKQTIKIKMLLKLQR